MSQYHFQHIWSEAAQLEAKVKIAALSDKKDLMLVTGAGFSNNFGYPRWEDFLHDLKLKCNVDLDENRFITDEGIDYLKYAQEIFNNCRENDFQNFIYETCDQSRCKRTFDEFYNTLISMGFCGFITLNYDRTLEIITQYFKPEIHIDTIDFCVKDREINIRHFLANASHKKNEHCYILHLHGVYTTPSKVILTQNSYERCYLNGSITELVQLITELKKEAKDQPKFSSRLFEIERRINAMYKDRALQSLHRKIIWILFTFYHLLFIGFSTDDKFFMDLLNVVKDDFMLPSTPNHYVLTSFKQTGTQEEERKKENISRKMNDRGVFPVFYPVIDSNYEKGLRDIILEIDNLKTRGGEDSGELPTLRASKENSPSDQTINDITSRTMRL